MGVLLTTLAGASDTTSGSTDTFACLNPKCPLIAAVAECEEREIEADVCSLAQPSCFLCTLCVTGAYSLTLIFD